MFSDSFIRLVSDRPWLHPCGPEVPLQTHDSESVCLSVVHLVLGHLVVQQTRLETDLVCCCCVFRVVRIVIVAMAAAVVPMLRATEWMDGLFVLSGEVG